MGFESVAAGPLAEWLAALRGLDGNDLLLVAGSQPMIRCPHRRRAALTTRHGSPTFRPE